MAFYDGTPRILSYGTSSFLIYFQHASSCLPLRKNFPFLVFLTFRLVALLKITFSIKNGDNLAWQVLNKVKKILLYVQNKIIFQRFNTMNLGNSAAPFSESLRYRFVFEEAISSVCSSLVLCSTIHHGVQSELEIYQEENPFASFETGLLYQYTRAVRRISITCQFQAFSRHFPVVKVLFTESSWPSAIAF